MLRTLGVLFIVGCCFVAGIVGIAGGYLILRSDLVRRAVHRTAVSAAAATSTQNSGERAPAVLPLADVRVDSNAVVPVQFEEPAQPSAGLNAAEAILEAGIGLGDGEVTPAPATPAWSVPLKVIEIVDEVAPPARKWRCDVGQPTEVLLAGNSAKLILEKAGDAAIPTGNSYEDLKGFLDKVFKSPGIVSAVEAGPTVDSAKVTLTLNPGQEIALVDRHLVNSSAMKIVSRNGNVSTAPRIESPSILTSAYSTSAASTSPTPIFGDYFRLRFSVNISPAVSQPQFLFANAADGIVNYVRPDSLRPVSSDTTVTYEAVFKNHSPRPWGATNVTVVLANGLPGGHAISSTQVLAPRPVLVKPDLQWSVTPPAMDAPEKIQYTNAAEQAYAITSDAIPVGEDVVLVVREGSQQIAAERYTQSGQSLRINIAKLSRGVHSLAFLLTQGDSEIGHPIIKKIERLESGPNVRDVDDRAFRSTKEGNVVYLYFDNPAAINRDTINNSFELLGPNSNAVNSGVASAKWVDSLNALELTLKSGLDPGRYRLKLVNSPALRDLAGNPPQPFDKPDLDKLVDAALPTVVDGVRPSGAPFIRYPEFNPPRDPTNGFNPSDKTVTRVARLYYFRDAHRVAQIVNRKAQSYNRQGAEMARQVADKSAREADFRTDKRLELEQTAVRDARSARESEEALEAQQQSLIQYREMLARTQESLDRATQDLAVSQASARNAQSSLDAATISRDEDEVRETQLLEKKDAVPPTITEDELAELTEVRARLKGTRETIAKRSTELQGLNTRMAAQTSARDSLQSRWNVADTRVRNTEATITTLLAKVSTERNKEIESTKQWESADREEARAREEQFRREVAAAKEDPDTFAAGYPGSIDPVEQVSITVVGEGLIQLRGPRKGVNIVHTMINELDAPVGQVHISMHTVQINGEHEDRMEPVALYIEQYLDHSRFLTTQSAQYLRNAVVQVASEKAEQMLSTLPAECDPLLRERKYREAFFGADFLNELGELDSEFLHADNKVLSLHSMDTTSLASALFLLALAKNDTREEILARFMGLVQTQLPIEERTYFIASEAPRKFGPCCHKSKFEFMAENARFVNLRGFFQNDVLVADTLTPAQREFVRLAQIYKARLVTEIELRQRVMERALIEERIGVDYRDRLKQAAAQDEETEKTIQNLVAQRQQAKSQVLAHFQQLKQKAIDRLQIPPSRQFFPQELIAEIMGAVRPDRSSSRMASVQNVAGDIVRRALESNNYELTFVHGPYDVTLRFEQVGNPKSLGFENLDDWRALIIRVVDLRTGRELSAADRFTFIEKWDSAFRDTVNTNIQFLKFTRRLGLWSYHAELRDEELKFLETQLQPSTDEVDPGNLRNLIIVSINGVRCAELRNHIESVVNDSVFKATELGLALGDQKQSLDQIFVAWQKLRTESLSYLRDPEARKQFESELFEPIDRAFSELAKLETQVKVARETAELTRRPLDHKKFLDMLIDDVEEKYIELVEGTRAHTANVDNYVKRLATALDDDFNTQFYYPAFRHVRQIGTSWDVQLGQIETTSILTNNRTFAKVDPQATMEFDLPKRDILINEAFESALAAYNDYGALLADPQFLALTKMYGGQPASATYGNENPSPMVRNVLPGLPSVTDANYLSMSENNVPQIGASLEALIPDPAVYKFETGTGYEIRPVIQPDGQAVVFHLNYLYTTRVREPVRADEKHLGRVKRHFIDTDVQLGNYELRKVSRYNVALKASRTSRGVPFLENAPLAGFLFRPMPQQESSLQQNLVLAQATIFPTLFDLMGLRWAPAVADLGTVNLREREFVTRNRERYLRNEVFDYSSLQVDDFMRVPEAERRPDLYRTQEMIPFDHPNGYQGKGLNIESSHLREGYNVQEANPESQFIPERGAMEVPGQTGEIIETVPPVFQESMPPGVQVLPGDPRLPLPPQGRLVPPSKSMNPELDRRRESAKVVKEAARKPTKGAVTDGTSNDAPPSILRTGAILARPVAPSVSENDESKLRPIHRSAPDSDSRPGEVELEDGFTDPNVTPVKNESSTASKRRWLGLPKLRKSEAR